jgi:hypothetical protein
MDLQEGSSSPSRLDPLARPDKWYLAAGEGVVWAPPFPEHLDRPGFWDPAHVFHFPIAPLFTVALVDARGREISLTPLDREWRPDRLRVRWAVGGTGVASRDAPLPRDPGVTSGRSALLGPSDGVLVEERSVLSDARFGSVWTVEDGARDDPAWRGLWLAAFTKYPDASGAVEGPVEGGVAWRRRVVHREDLKTELGFDLVAARVSADESASLPIHRRAVRSEGRETPRWALTPFPELWGPGGLGDDVELRGLPERGLVHLAVALPLVAEGPGDGVAAEVGSSAVSFTLRIRTPGYLPPSVELDRAEPPQPATPGASARRWEAAFAPWPRFRCSDPWLTRYWDYRLYGLHLNRLEPGPEGYPHPAFAEGIEYFHWPISYSAQCHMMEARWCADPGTARGSLLNFLAAQRSDGSLPGRLPLCPDAPAEPDFYHANWGDAVLAVDALHPDDAFLAEAYEGLARYAHWLVTARDPEGSGMVTVTNHYETGQEYMSRYLAVDPTADTTEWEPRLALKGIDVTVYLHRLQRALAVMARRLGRDDGARRWEGDAASTARAVLDVMWDDEIGIFSDVDAARLQRTGVKAAVCFYPLLTDLLSDTQVRALLDHLTDPSEFWSPWPVPSSSMDDPLFDAEGLWKGKRHNCPWNGRVWPMTNSHVLEGLLRQWRAGCRQVGPVAAELLSRFVRMMFDDQDPDRPNCFEHYNPFTAHPSRFRGIDDYQHSWVLDLVARGVAGLDPDGWLDRPGAEQSDRGSGARTHALVVDPLPMGIEEVDLEGARIRGRSVDVRIRGNRMAVRVDGVEHRGTLGEPLRIELV